MTAGIRVQHQPNYFQLVPETAIVTAGEASVGKCTAELVLPASDAPPHFHLLAPTRPRAQVTISDGASQQRFTRQVPSSGFNQDLAIARAPAFALERPFIPTMYYSSERLWGLQRSKPVQETRCCRSSNSHLRVIRGKEMTAVSQCYLATLLSSNARPAC